MRKPSSHPVLHPASACELKVHGMKYHITRSSRVVARDLRGQTLHTSTRTGFEPLVYSWWWVWALEKGKAVCSLLRSKVIWGSLRYVDRKLSLNIVLSGTAAARMSLRGGESFPVGRGGLS